MMSKWHIWRTFCHSKTTHKCCKYASNILDRSFTTAANSQEIGFTKLSVSVFWAHCPICVALCRYRMRHSKSTNFNILTYFKGYQSVGIVASWLPKLQQGVLIGKMDLCRQDVQNIRPTRILLQFSSQIFDPQRYKTSLEAQKRLSMKGTNANSNLTWHVEIRNLQSIAEFVVDMTQKSLAMWRTNRRRRLCNNNLDLDYQDKKRKNSNKRMGQENIRKPSPNLKKKGFLQSLHSREEE